MDINILGYEIQYTSKINHNYFKKAFNLKIFLFKLLVNVNVKRCKNQGLATSYKTNILFGLFIF